MLIQQKMFLQICCLKNYVVSKALHNIWSLRHVHQPHLALLFILIAKNSAVGFITFITIIVSILITFVIIVNKVAIIIALILTIKLIFTFPIITHYIIVVIIISLLIIIIVNCFMEESNLSP